MKPLALLLALLLLFIASAYVATAQTLGVTVEVVIPCSNYNYQTSPACTPATFEQTVDGWHGTLANGSPWTQTYITRNIMLFEGEQMRWLVYKDKIAYLKYYE